MSTWGHRRAASRGWAAVLACTPVLLLAGCGSVDGQFTIGLDERMSSELRLEVDTTGPDSSFGDEPGVACQVLGQSWPWLSAAHIEPLPGADGKAACRLTGTTEVAKLSRTGTASESPRHLGLWVEHADGAYRFQWDPPGLSDSESGFRDQLGSIDSFRLSVTFPGEVRSHSGSSTVDGATVTWRDPADFLAADGLQAEGDDRPSLGLLARAPATWVVLFGLGLAGWLGVHLVRRRRKLVPELTAELDDADQPQESLAAELLAPAEPLSDPESVAASPLSAVPDEVWAPTAIMPPVEPGESRAERSPWAPPQ